MTLGTQMPQGDVSPSPIIVAKGLAMEFAGFKAVDDVDLDVHEGRIHALIGPNGAGKTTLFNMLTKFLTPTRGSIFYRGTDVTPLSATEIARLGVIRSFQISSIFSHLTVLENVQVPLQRKNGLTMRFWQSESVLRTLEAEADALLDTVGMLDSRNVEAGNLPYGQKRILELAVTLALDPAVMLLDEPIAGIAYEDIDRITHLIRKISANRTTVMVEHNLGVVAKLCDRVTVLQRGRILADGSYAEVSQDPQVRKAYMGAADE